MIPITPMTRKQILDKYDPSRELVHTYLKVLDSTNNKNLVVALTYIADLVASMTIDERFDCLRHAVHVASTTPPVKEDPPAAD